MKAYHLIRSRAVAIATSHPVIALGLAVPVVLVVTLVILSLATTERKE